MTSADLRSTGYELPPLLRGYLVRSSPPCHSTLVEPRLYQLIRQPESFSVRTFEIIFDAPGVEAYAFTFG